VRCNLRCNSSAKWQIMLIPDHTQLLADYFQILIYHCST